MAEKGIFDLSGRVALITGGGSGIGRAYCEAMAEFGADVACNDINMEGAQETVELIKRFGHRAIAIKADASKQDEIEYMVNRTVEELGSIDIVFANVGISFRDKKAARVIHELAVEDWDRGMAIQPRGVFLLMRAVFPLMMKKRRGSFISTASVAGVTAIAAKEGRAVYHTAKAAVMMLTRAAARQYGEYGIRVNCIAPGGHRTPDVNIPVRVRRGVLGSITPLGREGLPEELKGLAVYLASDASSFVTGQTFVQDGGFTA